MDIAGYGKAHDQNEQFNGTNTYYRVLKAAFNLAVCLTSLHVFVKLTVPMTHLQTVNELRRC